MKLRYIAAFLLLVGIASCEERTPRPFDDISGICFDNRSGLMTVTDSMDLTFVYESADTMEVAVKVQLIGRCADEDRPFTVIVTSDDAENGVDYLLPDQAVMPAGAYEVDYIVRLCRTEALKQERKMVELELRADEFFDLPVTEAAQISDTVSLVNLRIFFSDMFTQAPSAWEENLLGGFTQQKFELICKVLGIDPADFNDPSLMTLARQLYVSAEMTAYVEGERQKMLDGEDFDEEAFDSVSGEPLTFR